MFRRNEGVYASNVELCLRPELGAFCSQCFIFGSAQIAPNAIFIYEVYNKLVTKLVAPDKELNRLVGRAILLFQPAIIDLNKHVVLGLLRVGFAELQLDICDPRHLVFLWFLNIKLKEIALAFVAISLANCSLSFSSSALSFSVNLREESSS